MQLILTFLLFSSSFAPATVEGLVTDIFAAPQPNFHISVKVHGRRHKTKTDKEGHYIIRIPRLSAEGENAEVVVGHGRDAFVESCFLKPGRNDLSSAECVVK